MYQNLDLNTSPDYAGVIKNVARRLIESGDSNGLLLMEAAGAMGYLRDENRRLRKPSPVFQSQPVQQPQDCTSDALESERFCQSLGNLHGDDAALIAGILKVTAAIQPDVRNILHRALNQQSQEESARDIWWERRLTEMTRREALTGQPF